MTAPSWLASALVHCGGPSPVTTAADFWLDFGTLLAGSWSCFSAISRILGRQGGGSRDHSLSKREEEMRRGKSYSPHWYQLSGMPRALGSLVCLRVHSGGLCFHWIVICATTLKDLAVHLLSLKNLE